MFSPSGIFRTGSLKKLKQKTNNPKRIHGMIIEIPNVSDCHIETAVNTKSGSTIILPSGASLIYRNSLYIFPISFLLFYSFHHGISSM